MSFTTLSIRIDVAKKLRAARLQGESYSDTLERLLEDQPAKTGGEFLDSLAPLEGRGLFTPAEREALRRAQAHPRRSKRKRRASA